MSASKNSRGLTVKQENFCQYYIEEKGNGSAAYRRAYDAKNMSDDSVRGEAFKVMQYPHVSKRIGELQAIQQSKSNLTKQRVLKELEVILEANIADYVELKTISKFNPTSKQYELCQELVYKDFKDLTKDQLKAIEGVKPTRNGIELKLHGKSWTIERISKMLGYDAPVKVEEKQVDEFSKMSDEELKEFIQQ